MPVAFKAAGGLAAEEEDEEGPSSSWERSRPLERLVAVLVFLGAERAVLRSFSSAARRASFSAFLRAASALRASASSLFGERVRWALCFCNGSVGEEGRGAERRGETRDVPLAVRFGSFAPFCVLRCCLLCVLGGCLLGCYFCFLEGWKFSRFSSPSLKSERVNVTFAIPAAFFVFSPAGFFGILRFLEKDFGV